MHLLNHGILLSWNASDNMQTAAAVAPIRSGRAVISLELPLPAPLTRAVKTNMSSRVPIIVTMNILQYPLLREGVREMEENMIGVRSIKESDMTTRGGIIRALLFPRIVYWQPVELLAFDHCACRHSAGHISYNIAL